jgi:hypothetical protein
VRHSNAAARREAKRVVLVATVVGSVAIVAFLTYRDALLAWAASDMRHARFVVALLAALISVPTLVVAWHVWHFGHRVVRQQRYPPADASLKRNTPVARGDAARWRGRTLQALAAALGLAAACLVGLLWRLWQRL